MIIVPPIVATLLMLLNVCLALLVHVVLRIVAGVFRVYGLEQGLTRWSARLRRAGLIMPELAIVQGGLGAFLLPWADLPWELRVSGAQSLLVAGLLVVSGVCLLFQCRRGPVTGGLEAARRTVWSCNLLSHLALGLSLVFSCSAVYSPVVAVPLIFLLTGYGSVIVLVDFLSAWSRRVQEGDGLLTHCALALFSGRPLGPELEVLAESAWGRRRQQLQNAAVELSEGGIPADVLIHTLSLSRLDNVQIAAGLQTGNLPQVLGKLQQRRTESVESLMQTSNPAISAFYLWWVLISLMAIIGFIDYWVVPKFRKIFDDFDLPLPETTQFLMTNWHYLMPGYFLAPAAMCLVAGVVMLPLASSHSRLREWFSRFWPRICLPDILRTLAYAVDARLPLDQALQPLVRQQLRLPLHLRLTRIQHALKNGDDCWTAFVRHGLLKPAEAAVLHSAEQTDNLAWALETVSRRFEQTWKYRLLICSEIIQPLVMLLIGLVVGWIALAFFLPLVQLINHVVVGGPS